MKMPLLNNLIKYHQRLEERETKDKIESSDTNRDLVLNIETIDKIKEISDQEEDQNLIELLSKSKENDLFFNKQALIPDEREGILNHPEILSRAICKIPTRAIQSHQMTGKSSPIREKYYDRDIK